MVMMMKKLLTQRLFNISKMVNCRISSSSLAVRTRVPRDPGEGKIDPEPGDSTDSRRFLHKFSMNFPIGESLMLKLREMDVNKDRIRFDGISPPMKSTAEEDEEETVETTTTREELGINVEDAKKLLRAAQMEVVRTKLMEIGKSWIPYSDFVGVCNDLDPVQGPWIAKMLDDSGNVIVLGNSVCLRPDQVTKSIVGLLPLPQIRNPNDPRRKELRELEAIKTIIDEKAHYLARREFWAGLGYLILQTAGLMRLTFWELTWDVMEPICFGVTTVYFVAGYAFFLKTSKEPSFAGFYQSRFEAKQRKLMESHEFDVERYNELKKLFNPKRSSAAVSKILGTILN